MTILKPYNNQFYFRQNNNEKIITKNQYQIIDFAIIVPNNCKINLKATFLLNQLFDYL